MWGMKPKIKSMNCITWETNEYKSRTTGGIKITTWHFGDTMGDQKTH